MLIPELWGGWHEMCCSAQPGPSAYLWSKGCLQPHRTHTDWEKGVMVSPGTLSGSNVHSSLTSQASQILVQHSLDHNTVIQHLRQCIISQGTIWSSLAKIWRCPMARLPSRIRVVGLRPCGLGLPGAELIRSDSVIAVRTRKQSLVSFTSSYKNWIYKTKQSINELNRGKRDNSYSFAIVPSE